MNPKSPYPKLEKELDDIITAEIQFRAQPYPKKMRFKNILQLLEKKNREIVEAHQQGKIASIIPSLFTGYLQVKENGILFVNKGEFPDYDYESYADKRGRLEVLVAASVNALQDEDLVSIFSAKNKTFDTKYLKALQVRSCIENARQIKIKAEEIESRLNRDEEEAIAYLMQFTPMKIELQQLRTKYLEFYPDAYMENSLQQLQQSIAEANKSIDQQTAKATKYLFDRALSVIRSHRSTNVSMNHFDTFIKQKKELERFAGIFESLGDEDKRDQVRSQISIVESTLVKLQTDIEKQKQYEATLSEKSNQAIQDVYRQFLEIKDDYSNGKLDTETKTKQALKQLRKCIDALKSHGQRVKARDIERFINSTGIAKKKKKSLHSLPSSDQFYKRAFFIMLPVTIGLLVIIFFLVSG